MSVFGLVFLISLVLIYTTQAQIYSIINRTIKFYTLDQVGRGLAICLHSAPVPVADLQIHKGGFQSMRMCLNSVNLFNKYEVVFFAFVVTTLKDLGTKMLQKKLVHDYILRTIIVIIRAF